MSDYKIFSGDAQIDQVKSRQTNGSLTEEDNTFLTLLNVSNLDLDKLVQLGQGNVTNYKQRQYNLAGGAEILTLRISGIFSQRSYELDYRVDGNYFFTYIKDDYDTSLIELEQRSRGFQWFFSFDLMLTHETKETLKGSIILLDEPGLHLHPEAQEDLLKRLEAHSGKSNILYTTHLPFMIDLNHPDRIRILKETDNGIVVTTNFTESSKKEKLVLQAALGMKASQSFLVAKRNLVVEGKTDYWILTELSNLLKQNGDLGLPDDVHITPGTGASEVVPVVTFMIGQNLDVVALFDSDKVGQDAKNKIVKNWLTQSTESHTEVILLGDAFDVSGDLAIEDLFPENFMQEIIKETYSKELADTDVDKILLPDDSMMINRINGFLKQRKIQSNNGSISKRLRDKLSSMKDISDLPQETKENAIKLFQEIRIAFGEKE